MRTTLDLPDDLFREANIHAAVKGISLKELFTEALRKALLAQPLGIALQPSSQTVTLAESPSQLP